MDGGFTAFKLKVGSNLEDDKRRLAIMRRTIGEPHLFSLCLRLGEEAYGGCKPEVGSATGHRLDEAGGWGK